MNYFMPTRLFTGEECLSRHGEALRALGRRCLIVTGGQAAKVSGALEDTLRMLEAQGIGSIVWDGVAEVPSVSVFLCHVQHGELGVFFQPFPG